MRKKALALCWMGLRIGLTFTFGWTRGQKQKAENREIDSRLIHSAN
jgi:hypothetical protein